MKNKYYILASIVVLFALGCHKRQTIKPVEEITQPPAPQVETKEEPSIRYNDWTQIPNLETIYFDFDSYNLTENARETLKKNAEYLNSHTEFNILIEGHCDERGTTEYNLALGQKRAVAVREYYIKLGIAPSRIGTISYGEEKPVDYGHTEDAWAKNRRAETKIRNVK